MNRIFVFCAGLLLVLPVLLFYLWNSKPNHSFIRKGTTVILWADKDSITVAADARNQVYQSDNSFYFTDTTNKIFKAGNFFFVFIGTESLGDQSLRSIVVKNYDPGLDLEKNCKVINEKISLEVQRFYSTLTIDQRSFFHGRDMSNFHVNLFVTGYNKNKPIIGLLRVIVKKDGDVFLTIPEKPTFGPMPNRILTLGYDDHINDALFDRGNNNTGFKTNDIIKLIALEAENHQEVDSNVNYVIIKPQSFRWGRNYK